jgi:gliding motility-associated-like protein
MIDNLSYAQLTTTSASGITPQQLVQSMLLGSGVTVSNVKFNGSLLAPSTSNQLGSFTTGSTPTNLGFSNGIIMSTGGIAGATNGQTTTNISGTPLIVVTELNQYTGSAGPSSIHDAAVLEFDFLPLSDTIKFRYAFGSREYPAFVCSSFNDVFGFFITGLNPNGGSYNATNIALIPNSSNIVSINTVNGGISAGTTTPCILTNTQYYHTSIANITYNGLTKVLTAKAVVVPCTPYHIKLAIADLGDNAYDSGVFLEANSFSTNAVAMATNYSSATATPMAIEGCNNAIIKFTIPTIKTDTSFFPLIISGTAINGVDYQHIPNMIFIPPGQLSTTLSVIPIVDGINEPIESVYIKVADTTTTGCALTGDSVSIYILSRDSITLTMSNDTTICQPPFPANPYSTPISVTASGGSGALFYLWSPAASLSAATIFNPISTPVANTTYTVTVKDNTGCPSSTASLTITVNQQPVVSFTSTPPLPTTGCAPLAVTLNDETTPTGGTRVWDFGDGGSSTDINATHTYQTSGVYSIKLSVNINGCNGESILQNAISILPQPIADFTWTPSIGTRLNPVLNFINLTTPDDTSFTWKWDFGDGKTDNIKNPIHLFPSTAEEKDYKVTLYSTSIFGCNDTVSYNAKIVNDVLVFPNIITPNGDGVNDKFEIGALTKGGAYTETQLLIYNRWGRKVYESNNYKNDFGGEGLPDGVYYVNIIAKGIFKDVEYKSSLQILR